MNCKYCIMEKRAKEDNTPLGSMLLKINKRLPVKNPDNFHPNCTKCKKRICVKEHGHPLFGQHQSHFEVN